MRVTNTMMTNSALLNIGKNKETYYDYLEQYTTQKKISKPSDDPTIAARALKYRTTASELTQYLDKNIEDGLSWMDATEAALSDVSSILEKMNYECNQGANGTLTTDDRNSISSLLTEYKSSVYEEQANADYAGRYLFSGYRTDTSMLFPEDTSENTYKITQNFDTTDLDKISYVYGGAKYDSTSDAADYAAAAPQYLTAHRALLGYSNLDGTGDYVSISYSYKDATDGTIKTTTLNAKTTSLKTYTTYNEQYKPADGEANFIPETGEVVFSEDLYNKIQSGNGFSVQYNKTNFSKNDIRPEHYFDCTATNAKTGKTVTYSNPENQQIDYEINFSQSLTVNTLACDSIDINIGRKVDTIQNAITSLAESETKLTEVKKKITDAGSDTATLTNLNELKSQIETEISLKEKTLQETFSAGISMTTEAQDKVSVAIADHGARYNRLTMTKSKLENQKTNLEEMQSDNEDVDIGDAYIKYNQADMLYQASLSATSKIMSNSILNFI